MIKNPLFRLLAVNAGAGIILAVGIVSAMIGFDVFRLHSLLASSDHPVLVVVLMMAGFIVTISSLMMGSAIMMLPQEASDNDRGPPLCAELVPVRVTMRNRKHPR